MNQKRQPRGIPVGGEFAANEHDEAGSTLVASDTPRTSTYGDVKVTYTDYGYGVYTAETYVHKSMLPEWNTRLTEVDEEGFLPIASWNTGHTIDEPQEDIEAVVRAQSVTLQRKLSKEDYRSRHRVMLEHSIDQEGVRNDPREVVVLPGDAVDQAMADFDRDKAEDKSLAEVNRTEMRLAMEQVAERSILAQRQGDADVDALVNDIVNRRFTRFPRATSDKIRVAVARAGMNGADMVSKRRAAQVDQAITAAMDRHSGDSLYESPADKESLRSVLKSVAVESNSQVWREKVGSYEEIAEKGISQSPMSGWYAQQTDDQRAQIDAIAVTTALRGHSSSLTDYVSEIDPQRMSS